MIGGWLGWGYKGPVPKPLSSQLRHWGIKRHERQAMAFLHHALAALIIVPVFATPLFPEKYPGPAFRLAKPESRNVL